MTLRCPFVPGDAYVANQAMYCFHGGNLTVRLGDLLIEVGTVITVISVTPNEQSRNWVYEGGVIDESATPFESVHFYPRAWNVQVMIGSKVKTFTYDHWEDRARNYRFYRSLHKLASAFGRNDKGEKSTDG